MSRIGEQVRILVRLDDDTDPHAAYRLCHLAPRLCD